VDRANSAISNSKRWATVFRGCDLLVGIIWGMVKGYGPALAGEPFLHPKKVARAKSPVCLVTGGRYGAVPSCRYRKANRTDA